MGVKWEYETAWVGLGSGGVVNMRAVRDRLFEIGNDGWELVAIIDGSAIFKRPVKPEPPAVMVVNVNGRQMNEVLEMVRTELDNYFERPMGG